VALVSHRETDDHAVAIECFTDGALVFSSVMSPAVARDVAADLIQFAADCDAAVAGAAAVATAAICSAKEG
jgi:hypothetical protein